MFQNACATEADIEWGEKRENCQNLSASILTSYFAVVYKVFCFLRAAFEFGIPRNSNDMIYKQLQFFCLFFFPGII